MRGMTVQPLWTSDAIATATGGAASAAFVVSGVAFDSREVGPGDLFFALKGEAADGHRFVTQAFAQGAAGVVVSAPVDGPHVLVADTTAALEALGVAARARTDARIIGVTGSAGKTGSKEALAAALERAAPGRVHRSVKSYNNHVGVPLSLARMPADTLYAVFEMGMSAPGELDMLTRMVRPHVALVTTIAPAHAAFFPDEAAIADAKGEVFRGLEPGGVGIVPQDSPHRDRLFAAAEAYAAKVVTFGSDKRAHVRLRDALAGPRGTLVSVTMPDVELTFTLAPPGAHWVSNALGVIAAVDAVGGDLAAAGLALGELEGLKGRGARTRVALDDGGALLLIDESYNANPASMAATIALLGEEKAARRIVVLGAMRELGSGSDDYHAALAEPLVAANVDFALLVGDEMAALATALEGRIDFEHVADAAWAWDNLHDRLAAGDAVLVKGSNSVGLGLIVDAITSGKT